MNTASSTSAYVETIIQNLSGLSSFDLLIVGALFVALVGFGLLTGRTRLIVLLFALYPAALVFPWLPGGTAGFFGIEGGHSVAIMDLSLFVLLGAAFHFALYRHVEPNSSFGDSLSFFEGVLLGVSGMILLLAFYYHVLTLTALYDFGLSLDTLFTQLVPPFWLLIAPLVVFFFVARR